MDKINSNGNYIKNIKNEAVITNKGNHINQKSSEIKPDCFVSSKKPEKKTGFDVLKSKANEFYNKLFKKDSKEVNFCGNKKEDENQTVIINLAPLYLMTAAAKAKQQEQKQELPPIVEDFPEFYEALNETLENLEPDATFEDFMNEITPYTPTMDIMGLIEEMKPALKQTSIEKLDNMMMQYIKDTIPEDELETLGRQAIAELIQRCMDNNDIHTMTLDELEKLANEEEEDK